jgi:lipopolysaccharide transport system permease protein
VFPQDRAGKVLMSTPTSSNADTLKPEPAIIRTKPAVAAAPHLELPDNPLVTIQPGKAWSTLSFRDLWSHRELLYFLIWRDVKVRYKQTVLGVAWAVLQPLLMMVIFSLLFGRVAGMPSDGIPYPLFAYGGLLAWTFFASAVTNSGNSLVGSAHLITKVYFPRIIIPTAAVCAAAVDLILSFVVLVPLMIYYRVPITWQLAMLPLLLLLLMTLALGVGMWMSALNVKYRDVRFALPFLTLIWMFLSPVIYPLSRMTGKLKLALTLNPVTGIIEGFRSALFGLPFNWFAILISAVISFLMLIYAVFWFRRMEREFADIV